MGTLSFCVVTYGWFHALATPQECSPQINVPLELQSDYGQFRDIPCLTIDSIFIGQFHFSICDFVIAEIIGP